MSEPSLSQSAQEDGRVGHPLIGVWTVEIAEAGKPHVERATHTYHPDGSMAIAAAAYAAHGAWTANGDHSAAVAALLPIPPGGGFSGFFDMRANVQVADDGRTFQMSAAISRPTPSGVPAQRQATVTGRRFTVDTPPLPSA